MRGILTVVTVACMATILFSNTASGQWSLPILHEELNDQVTGETALAPNLSSDELTIYFRRYNTDGIGQLFEAYREESTGAFTFERAISELYTNYSGIATPWVSEDGLRLYYSRFFSYSTAMLIRMAKRESISEPWGPAIDFTYIHVDGYNDVGQSLTQDELTMFYISARSGTLAVWMATRKSIEEQFSNPVYVSELNDSEPIKQAYILPDGLTIYLSAMRDGNLTFDIYRSSRFSTDEPFGNIELVNISTDTDDESRPFVTPDEKKLYFTTTEGIFVSYWIESPYNDAVENIMGAIDKKRLAITNISDAIDKENNTLIALDELLKSGELGDLKPQDIKQAKQRVKTVKQHQINIREELSRSLLGLEKALNKLNYVPQ